MNLHFLLSSSSARGSTLLLAYTLTGCTLAGRDSSEHEEAAETQAAALWDDAVIAAPVSSKLGFSAQELQTSGLGIVDGYATLDEAADALIWRKPALTGEFFVVCAPTRLPGVDSSMTTDTFPSGILGARLQMKLRLDAAALANPDTRIMSATPGYYLYGDLGDPVWVPEEMSQEWSAKDIQSGVLADYAFDRGVAYRKKHGISGPNCGVTSCASQDLPQAQFAEDKTCVQITLLAREDGTSPVAEASVKRVEVESLSYGFKANFPRKVSFSYSCSLNSCEVPPTVAARGEPNSEDDFTYSIRPISAQPSDIPGVMTSTRPYYSFDHGLTRNIVNMDDPAVYRAAPLVGTGASGLVIGAFQRTPAHGAKEFTFEIVSIEPTLETLKIWKRQADDLAISVNSDVGSYKDVFDLASMLELELRQANITLGGIETLLIYSANRSEAKRQDLYYTDGPNSGKPRVNDDLPSWFKAAAADPGNLTFRRLVSIRAQIIAGHTVTDTDKGDAMATAEAAKERRRKALEATLDRADRLLERLVRWSSFLKVEQQLVRDRLLLKARAGRHSVLNGIMVDFPFSR